MGFKSSIITIQNPNKTITDRELLDALGCEKFVYDSETTFEQCMHPSDESINVAVYNGCIVITDDFQLSSFLDQVGASDLAAHEKALTSIFNNAEILTTACHSSINFHIYSLAQGGKKIRYKGIADGSPLVEFGEYLKEEKPIYANSTIVNGTRMFKSSYTENSDVYDNTEDQLMEDFTFGIAKRHLGIEIATAEDEELMNDIVFRKYVFATNAKEIIAKAPQHFLLDVSTHTLNVKSVEEQEVNINEVKEEQIAEQVEQHLHTEIVKEILPIEKEESPITVSIDEPIIVVPAEVTNNNNAAEKIIEIEHNIAIQQVVENKNELLKIEAVEPIIEVETLPIIKEETAPIVEIVAEPIVAAVAEPVVEDVAEPIVEPVAEPIVEPVAVTETTSIIEAAITPIIEAEEKPTITESIIAETIAAVAPQEIIIEKDIIAETITEPTETQIPITEPIEPVVENNKVEEKTIEAELIIAEPAKEKEVEPSSLPNPEPVVEEKKESWFKKIFKW